MLDGLGADPPLSEEGVGVGDLEEPNERSEEATTFISAGHLFLGYTLLGVILAVRPELTGARD